MHYRVIASGALGTASLLLAVPAFAATCTPGAEGIGDPYHPAYGNGGYDVSHYDLRLKYQPATDELEGTATLRARTTQDLSRFDLDFLLDVSEVRVNGVEAAFATVGEHESVITPWTVAPGDPGPENQFDIAVYDRGALAIQALRDETGDKAFFAVLKGWPRKHAYGNASVADFRRYTEEVSGKKLGALFDTWLFEPAKPSVPTMTGRSSLPVRPSSWTQIEATNGMHER
ncbi:M1 family aminopeptidase [Streptomyces sp. NPDC013157]|uniref:M1 family aminopeptidase n=1 Tax=Streptomyces sp. NPDC013157 TaxID=3364861 RepID=UPI003679D2A6